MGVETERYNPRIGADIERLIRPNTSVIILESPGSLTFVKFKTFQPSPKPRKNMASQQ